MAKSGESADRGRSGHLGRMLRKALAPLLSTVIHAASVYLGRKAGELAQEKLVPRLQGRSQTKQEPAKQPAAKKPAEDADSGRSAERRDREKRRSQRRKALEQAGSS